MRFKELEAETGRGAADLSPRLSVQELVLRPGLPHNCWGSSDPSPGLSFPIGNREKRSPFSELGEDSVH